MVILKALFIVMPFFLYAAVQIDWSPTQKKIVRLAFVSLLLVFTFSDVTFKGWLLDYVVFSIVATLCFSTFEDTLKPSFILVVRIVVSVATLLYCFSTLRFGGQLVEDYQRGRLTFRVYRIPDLVLSPTYELTIDKSIGLLEKRLYKKTVNLSVCRFDYIPEIDRLIKSDSCSVNERSILIN